MTYWKLGCRWGSENDDTPLFDALLRQHSIILCPADKMFRQGDLILLTDGHTGLAVARVDEKPVCVTNYPDLKAAFKKLWLPFDKFMFLAAATIYEIDKSSPISFKTQTGICRIHKTYVRQPMQTLFEQSEKMQNVAVVANLLKAKGQVILQGPPGTGKTWLAERVAEKLAAAEDVKLVQFHPAYAYEDFVRGITAQTDDEGHLRYGPKNKILADFAARAAKAPERSFVLIIDEINRANLPSVLGELIYALEYRGKRVESVYGDEETGDLGLILPKNLLVIGTMNTSDRSVGHLDYAIRRRFAFVPVLPDVSVIADEAGKRLFGAVAALFEKEFLAPEFERDQVQPGHSYFMTKANEGLTLAQKLNYEVRPLLQEYLRDGVLRPNAKEAVAALRA